MEVRFPEQEGSSTEPLRQSSPPLFQAIPSPDGAVRDLLAPSASSTTVSMTEERNATANFTVNFYDLNLFATSGGSVSGTGRFEHGTPRTVSATALPGYSFTGWSGEGITNGFSTATTVMMTQDRNLTASFSLQSYALAISESEGGAVTDQAGRYYHGSRINLFGATRRRLCFRSVAWRWNRQPHHPFHSR